jgi:hypothetical protein
VKGLSARERNVLLSCCGIEFIEEMLSEEELSICEALEKRGLVVSVECPFQPGDHQHVVVTTLGRLILSVTE